MGEAPIPIKIGDQDEDLSWLEAEERGLSLLESSLLFVQSYGWFVLIGSIVAYVVYHKIRDKFNHHQVYNLDRVEKLEMERKRQRLRQQAAWDHKAPELHAETLEKEKKVKRRKEDRKYVKKTKDDTPEADWLDQGRGGGGRPVSSIKERYKGRGGGGGGG